MRLELQATVDDAEIATATMARGMQGLRVSPAERAVWKAVAEASQDRLYDPDVERAVVAYVPEAVWAWMNQFADGGPFPRVRFTFHLESDDHAMRGIRLAPAPTQEDPS